MTVVLSVNTSSSVAEIGHPTRASPDPAPYQRIHHDSAGRGQTCQVNSGVVIAFGVFSLQMPKSSARIFATSQGVGDQHRGQWLCRWPEAQPAGERRQRRQELLGLESRPAPPVPRRALSSLSPSRAWPRSSLLLLSGFCLSIGRYMHRRSRYRPLLGPSCVSLPCGHLAPEDRSCVVRGREDGNE